jgi:WD40 repeat protein
MTASLGADPPDLNNTALVHRIGSHSLCGSWNSGDFALSTSGQLLAIALANRVCVFDKSTAVAKQWFVTTDRAWATRLVFTSDDQSIVWGGWGPNIHIGDVATGKVRKTIALDRSSTQVIVASPAHPALIYSGGGQQHSRLTDAQSGSIIAEIVHWDDDAEPSYVHQAAFSPDGEYLALLTNRSLDVWSVRNIERVFREHVPNDLFQSVVFSTDGDDLFVGTRNGCILSYNPRTGTKELEREVFDANHTVTQMLAIGHAPELLCFSNRSAVATVSTSSLKVRGQQVVNENPSFAQVDPAEPIVWLKLSDGDLGTLSLPSLKMQTIFENRDVTALRFAPTNDALIVGQNHTRIERVTLAEGTTTFSFARGAGSCWLSPHGETALVVTAINGRSNAMLANTKTGTIAPSDSRYAPHKTALLDNGDAWTIDGGRLTHVGDTNRSLDSAMFAKAVSCVVSPDHKRLAIRSPGFVTIVDAVNANIVASTKVSGMGEVVLDSNGGGVILQGKKLVFFTDATLQKCVMSAPFENFTKVTITEDGVLAAAATAEGIVYLVHRASPKTAVSFVGNVAQVQALAFSSDAKWLAVGATSPVVRVYSVELLLKDAPLSTLSKSAQKKPKTTSQKSTKATSATKTRSQK